MITAEEIKKLAVLTRISISDEELSSFAKDFDAIIGYMNQFEKLDLQKVSEEKPLLRNVMREDKDPHKSGMYTEKLVAQFPKKEGDYLSVKQIISHE